VARSEVLTFRLTARDNYGGQGIDEMSVTVTNDQPIASAGADVTVAAGAPVTLNGGATDADGSVASYRWEQLAGPAVSFANGTAAISFVAPSLSSPSTLTFRLTATDNDGGAHADDVTVSVQARPSSGGGGGGGGAMGWCVLLALAALTLGARRRAQR
jgi:hypothetical protein